MSRREYLCATCGQPWAVLFAALTCCDAVSNDLSLEDPPAYPQDVS